MRAVAVLAAVLMSTSLFAADPVEEVRQSEIAFAKAFADHDLAKFGELLAEDATFFNGLGALRGKKAIVDGWSRMVNAPEAPMSWGPERVAVTAAGDIGFSTGPVYTAAGKLTAYYTSMWRKQQDGKWKVIFDGPGSPVTWETEKVEEGSVTTKDGVTLHYQKTGNGPLTIVVPLGFVLFEDFRQFSDIATIIGYDPRNRGRSGRSDTASIQQDVEDLEAIRAHFAIKRFVPVGYSYLGKAVAIYALAHPEHVARVVQLGPAPNDGSKTYATHTRDDMGITVDQSKLGDCAEWARMISHMVVGDPKHASRVPSPCAYENEWPANFQKMAATHFPTIQKAMLIPEEVKKLTMPFLTIHGTKDRNAAYEAGRTWATELPNARFVSVPGAAHNSWSDDPVVVFGAIRQFLRGDWPMGSQDL
jgi:pimeloyl-ACP methyl ester carboxylesterase/ketosteroid isomerase-like protein